MSPTIQPMKFHAVAGAWSPCFPNELHKARAWFVLVNGRVAAHVSTKAEAISIARQISKDAA